VVAILEVVNSQFWTEVEQAYNKVLTNHKLEITVARDGKQAEIGYDWERNFAWVEISEANTDTREPLISP
jgi:hypothetical protein